MMYKTHRAFGVAFTASTLVAAQPYWHNHPEKSVVWSLTQICITMAVASYSSVIPDVDSIGRHHNIEWMKRVPHRGFTHTIWVVLILGYLTYLTRDNGLVYPAMWGLTAGYFSHLLGDSFSKAGVAWCYPLQKYRRYPNGGFVVKGHRGPFQPLYRVGRHPKYIQPIPIWYLIAGFFLGWLINIIPHHL